MTLFLDILISAALVVGGLFGLIGSYGLLRLREPMQRLHAPTKGTTLGVGAVLVASACARALHGPGASWHEILVTVFLFLTAPLTALFLARVHLHRTLDRATLPPTATGAPWASADLTLDES